MQISKLLTASVASLTLAFSPLFAQNVFAQATGAPTVASLSGSGVVAVGAVVTVAASNKGDSGSGTTGTTGTR